MLVVLVGCARSRTGVEGDASDARVDGDIDSGRHGREAGPGDGGFDFDVYVDPGCDGGRRDGGGTTSYECDPLEPESCGPGYGCYAYASPPTTPCGEEVFISFCNIAGPGTQGADCSGHTACAAGHLCVVTGAGTQCVRACDVAGGEPRCPRGFLCRSTDVPGYGACF